MESESFSVERDLLQGLQVLVDVFNKFAIRYALIGGIAASFRGRPRTTADLDFLLQVPQVVLPGVLEELRSQGFKFDLQSLIREWTDHHLAVLSYGAIRVDWIKPILPVYVHILDASQIETFLGRSISIASAEGLILTKLISFRPQDQADIASLIAANAKQLSLEWIHQEWKSLTGDDGEQRWRDFEAMLGQA